MAGPNVTIAGFAFSDPRFDAVAALDSRIVDSDHARGRCARLWHWCTERGTDVLPRVLVNAVVKVEALIDADLAELVPPDHVRLKGAKERIGWYHALSQAGKRGAAKRWGKDDSPPISTPLALSPPLGGGNRGGLGMDLVPDSGEEVQEERASGRQRKPRPPHRGHDANAEELVVAARVLKRLSERTRREYAASDQAHSKYVVGLLRGGHSEEDLRLVVWHKANEWLAPDRAEKMAAYVRPATLFHRSHFADYLAAARAAWTERQQRTNGHEMPGITAQELLRGGGAS